LNIAHLFFSPNGESEKIAKYFHSKLDGKLFNLTYSLTRSTYNFENEFDLIVLTIPVYSQQIPIPLRTFISKLKSKYVVINVTYGGFSYGNVLYDTYRKMRKARLIGYSITPVKHAYLSEDVQINFEVYDDIINRIHDQMFLDLKVTYRFKNIFARFFEKSRTHYNFTLIKNEQNCDSCLVCITKCPLNAIQKDLSIDLKKCIACGQCVKTCPKQVFKARYSKALKWYLNRKQKTNVIVQ
jgi:NAD-dependent dihydropyrimidine dehydrogenase PreA subunit